MTIKKDDFVKIQMDPKEFYQGAVKAEKFKKVTEQIIKEESSKLIDKVNVKRGEDWSILANQVVGSEKL